MAATAIQTSILKVPALTALLQRVAALHRRRATRRQLQSLTLDQLRDVGIDPDVTARGYEVPGDPRLMIRLMSLR